MGSVVVSIGLILWTCPAGFCQERSDPSASPQVPLPTIPGAIFQVTDYGAVGDGKTLNTAAIQKTIDAAAAAGGGTVAIPRGTFLTGPITLASHIDLEVNKDAVLSMDNDVNRYLREGTRWDSFITVREAQDVKIGGQGVIDGQGDPWWEAYREEESISRPRLVSMSRCKRIELQGVWFVNSPQFHISLKSCQDVTVHGITIRAPADSPNTDGLDLSGWNYLVTDCTFDVGDDNIALKPTGDLVPSCKDITITHCRFLHGHGLSIGSGSSGGVQNMHVSDCTFNRTWAGIRIKTSRGQGGLIQNLLYENLAMTNVRHPIEIIDYYPRPPLSPSADGARPVNSRTPVLRNVIIKHLTASGGEAAVIWGLPEMPISDIVLDHVRISTRRGMRVFYARGIRFLDSEVKAETGASLTVYNAEVTGLKGTPFQEGERLR